MQPAPTPAGNCQPCVSRAGSRALLIKINLFYLSFNMNRLSILLISLLAILGVSAQNGVPGQWKLHNAWGWYGGNVTDTPNRTYIIMPGQYYNSYLSGWGEDSKMLFVYDKETGEMQGYNAANYLHGNIVTNMAYNAQKGYLLIVYHDSKIDLLFDDDTVLAVPGLSTATVNSAKNVNNITFDPENSRAYLATDFGYIVIDDKKAVIAESHVYNKSSTELPVWATACWLRLTRVYSHPPSLTAIPPGPPSPSCRKSLMPSPALFL